MLIPVLPSVVPLNPLTSRIINLQDRIIILELFLKATVWINDRTLEFEPCDGLEGGEAVAEGEVGGYDGCAAGDAHATGI